MNPLSNFVRSASSNNRTASWILRVLDSGRGFLPVISVVWALATAAYVFVGFADPYEIRFVKNTVRLADHPYPEKIVPRLLPVAAQDGADLVVLGASTSVGYTPVMLRQAFRGIERPINLSFGCAGLDFFALAFPRLEASHTLKRFVINLDATFIKGCTAGFGNLLDMRFYNETWSQPVPDFSVEGIDVAVRVLRTGVLDRPAWQPRFEDRVEGHEDSVPPITASANAMQALTRAANIAHASGTDAPEFPCSDIPSLNALVIPAVRRMAARGVQIDFIAPPYSLANYSYASVMKQGSDGGGDFFVKVMALRRCVMEATSGVPHIQLHVFDTDFSITGDLNNYKDPIHLLQYDVYKKIAMRIAGGGDLLTPSKWPDFQQALKAGIDQYRP